MTASLNRFQCVGHLPPSAWWGPGRVGAGSNRVSPTGHHPHPTRLPRRRWNLGTDGTEGCRQTRRKSQREQRKDKGLRKRQLY